MDQILTRLLDWLDFAIAGDPVRVILAIGWILTLAGAYLIIRYQGQRIREQDQMLRGMLVTLLERMVDPSYQTQVRDLHQELRRRLGDGKSS